MSSSCFTLKISLYPIAIIAITKSANDNAFQIPLSNSIIANIPSVAVSPYKIRTACFCVYPLFISLWCKCPLSALNTAFIDLPFIILLIIAKIVSNIGSPNTIIGAISTNAVYVLATPSIDITASENPKKFEPTSPINVLAGLKLNGKNPTIEPANAVINSIDINGDDGVSKKIISNETHEISVIPDDSPSSPSIKLTELTTAK